MTIITVKTGGITADAITAAKIADNAVVTAAINADAVTDAKIADDVVGTEHLTANEVDTAALAADAVTAAQIADDAISEEHLDVTSITGHTAETSVADGDLVVIHDASASALRKMTIANLVANAGGGKILQAVSNTTNTETTNASTNMASSGLAKAITPSATSSKILILVGSNLRVAGDGGASNGDRLAKIAIFRGGVSGTELQDQIIGARNISDSSSSGVQTTNSISFAFLDSPSTTNATTYEIGIQGIANGDAQAQPFNYRSSIVLLEVGA